MGGIELIYTQGLAIGASVGFVAGVFAGWLLSAFLMR